MPDYYSILGVSSDASAQDIKRAYRKMARQLHPDMNPSEEAAEKFKEVSTAYEVLSDPEKRRIVDMGGDPLGQAQGGPGADFGGFSFSDIFDFFGAGAGMQGGGPRQSRTRHGKDSLTTLDLTLEECYKGGLHDLTATTYVLCEDCQGSGSASGSSPVTCPDCGGSGRTEQVQRTLLGNIMTQTACVRCQGTGEIIDDPCPRCGGDGRVRKERTTSVRIPAGVGDGMRVRLVSQGDVGPGGGPAGDLYVEIRQRPHPVFTRDNNDLLCTIDISVADAALGCECDIDLPDGTTHTVEVAAGTQPGAVITVRGQGMPDVRSKRRGNLVVHVNISIPTQLSQREKELMEELRTVQPSSARVLKNREDTIFTRLKHAFMRG